MVYSLALFQLVAALGGLGSVTALPAAGPGTAPEVGITIPLPYELSNGAAPDLNPSLANFVESHLSRRADTVDWQNSKAPSPVFEFTVGGNAPVLVGQRGDQTNYDKTHLCFPSGIDEGRQGKQLHMVCVQFTKKLTWDIRRFGEQPISCTGTKETKKTTITDTERNKVSVNLETSGSYAFISAKLGFSAEHEDTHTRTVESTIACRENFEGASCIVGGRAVTELKVMEGFTGPITGWAGDGSHPLGGRPLWDDMDNEGANFGMDDMSVLSRFSYNSHQYPTTWDAWPDTGDACYVNNNAFYDTDGAH